MQLTSDCMEHSHDHHNHHHSHSHETGEPFAPAAENLLFELAMQARDGALRVQDMPDIGELHELEEQFDIKNLRARLGDAYPDLGFMGEAAVIAAFAKQAGTLPTSHPRYDHSHGDGDGCGKTHGPVRRTLDTIEQKVLGRIRNQRVRLVAAAAFRGSSLILCPGDDLAAIGLQLYGAFSGHTGHEEHTHTEHVAILPGRPRIDLAKGTAVITSLPLDVTVPHNQMPDTDPARAWRERTFDPEPPAPKPEALVKPERPRRWRRLALIGAAAISFVGGGFAVANASHEAPQPAAKTPAVAPQQGFGNAPNVTEAAPPQFMHTERAQKGDSQWGMIQDEVHETLGTRGRTPLINALTHLSVHANKGEAINPGQQVQLPTREVIIKINSAVQKPNAADPRLVADLRILNAQNEFGSAESEGAIQRIKSYAF
jgi:hypothetical protein